MAATLIRFISLTILLATGWIKSPVFQSSISSAPIKFEITIPQESLNFSDLDLRDENNRPIQAPSLIRRVQFLFSRNLNELVLQNLTPLKREMFSRLSKTWDLYSGWLKKKLAQLKFLADVFWKLKQTFFKSLTACHGLSMIPLLEARPSNDTPRLDLNQLIVSTTRLLR